MKKILFVDNSTDHDLYKPMEHWKPLFTLPFKVYHAPHEEAPGLDTFTHMLISGSLSSTLENKAWMIAEEEFIRKSIDHGKVILGNCFGHQIIAKALFGEKAVRVREHPEIGWPDMTVKKRDILFGEQGDIVNGFVLHFDEVVNLPEDAVDLLLDSVECANLAFKLKEKPVWGIQPHFEIGIVQGFSVIELVQGPGIPGKEIFMNAIEKQPKDSGLITRIMREFQELAPLSV
jgi:GMP synthase-like glutamine amidotransferase